MAPSPVAIRTLDDETIFEIGSVSRVLTSLLRCGGVQHQVQKELRMLTLEQVRRVLDHAACNVLAQA
jgi:hypothetical protein